MPNPLTVDDINIGRPLTTAERAVMAIRIEDAWEILLGAVPSVDDRLVAGTLRLGLVKAVLREMVLRQSIDVSTAGATEVEEAVDDYRKRVRYSDGASSSTSAKLRGMQPTDEQIEMLQPPAGQAGSEGAWTIQPYASRARYGSRW